MEKVKYMSFALFAIFALTACDEVVTYNKNYDDGLTPKGAPEITYISPVAYPDSVINSGEMNQMVVIHGENLSQVKEILFNDQAVDLTEIYAVNKRITLLIPPREPETITNELKITTSKGSAVSSFEVKFPPLIITGFSNEFGKAGETIEMYGKNLGIYGLTPTTADIRINGEKVTVESGDNNAIRLILPVGITDNATMSVSSEKLLYRLGEPVELTYRDRGYTFIDWDDVEHPALVGCITDGSKTGDPAPLIPGMNFMRWNAPVADWSWNFIVYFYIFDLDFESDPVLSDMKIHAADYELKYEIFILAENAIVNPIDEIIVDLRNDKKMPKEDVLLPAASGIPFSTYGRWYTMKLADTTKYVKADGSTIFSSEENYIAVVITNATGKPSSFDVSMANFRFAKKIYFEKAPESSNK